MKLLDLVKTIGTSVVRNVVPGGGLVVDIVNEFLPKDKKLTSQATGSDISNAVDSLPIKQRAQLMEREFDVNLAEIKEGHSTIRAMLENEAKSTHTTRPFVIKLFAYALVFVHVVAILFLGYAIIIENENMVSVTMGGWPYILVLTAPFTTAIASYFGILRKEQGKRLDATIGKPSSNIINTILGR